MKHFNKLSPALLERLALLSEECAEVCMIVGKIIRHGYNSYNPDTNECNANLIEQEIGDLFAAIELLEKSDEISMKRIMIHKEGKLERVKQYLHHN